MKILFAISILLCAGLVGCGGNSDSQSAKNELEDLGVTIGESKTMTGEEFQQFLAEQGQNANPNESYLYIKIIENLDPVERGKKYGRPIEEVLAEKQLGSVTGGGTMMGRDGSFKYIGLDVATEKPEAAIDAIIVKLKEIGAPKDTVILRDLDGEETEIQVW